LISKAKRYASEVASAVLERRRFLQRLYLPSTSWVAELRSFRWLDDDRFEVTGWAYDARVDYTGLDPQIQVWAESRGDGARFVRLSSQVVASPEVNQPFNGATTDRDYSRTCFRAVGSVAALVAEGIGVTWQLRVGVAIPGSAVQGTFKKRYGLGPAAYLTSRTSGSATVRPHWSALAGLGISIEPLRPTATAVTIDVQDRSFSVDIVGADGLTSAWLDSPQGRVELAVRSDGDHGRLSGVLPQLDPDAAWAEADSGVWGNALIEEFGPNGCLPWTQYRLMVRRGDTAQPVLLASDDLAAALAPHVEAGPEGELRFDVGITWAVVTDLDLVGSDEPVLRLQGRCHGDLAAVTISLANGRDTRVGTVSQHGDEFSAEVPFLNSRWHLPALPPQIGRISLRATTAEGLAVPVRCTAQVIERAPDSVLNRWFRLYFSISSGKVVTPRLAIPATDEEIGRFNQARIQKQYLSGTWPIIDQMYFESFYGRQCGCSPLALRNELQATHPRVPRVWAVRDLSVAVPDGDRAVVDATTAWWQARAESRWLVVNDWLRARYAHRDGQTVLQTWHGTMYKKVGLDRGEQLDAEEREFMLGERTKWDLLLSQNPHSTRVFRESYLSNPPIYEEGYPRNDLLVNGEGGPIRDSLGIGATQKVVLYAPTWRDDRTELVDYLDVTQLSADLGEDYVVLLRAHSRVIRVGNAAKVGKGVIDVSTYPNTTDLLLIADVMITDYSSIMFDYAVTGRPMIFFTPDMDEYRDQLRGVYLDLEQVGPGPVVSTQDEVLAALRDLDQVAATFAVRYAKWQADYTPWDDGGSSARVLARYLHDAPPADAGILD
jgi:CDP-glycerol glycerophosphotransferase (TagB/SpsB family)